MANNWNIPNWLENEVRERNKTCVYCGVKFTPYNISRKTAASWEHIINEINIVNIDNIVLCCFGCNSSKGQKQLSVWLKSDYCKNRGINEHTFAYVVKKAIESGYTCQNKIKKSRRNMHQAGFFLYM